MTGLGISIPEVGEGAVTPLSPLSQTVVQAKVLISGQAASVVFSGMAPGLVGIYQVNASLPDDVSSKFEVVVQAGDRMSVPFVVQP
jgi:uncharacterized protein (TIGR03437 family)